MSKHENHSHHHPQNQTDQNNHNSHHHAHMIEDFKKRFWISLALTVPIMVLAPMIQGFAGYEWRFQYDRYVQFALSTVVFFYGGWPFLKGLYDEITDKAPGMMTLIALAIAVAYFYSSGVVFGLKGKIFFWELASLIDIMLLGHWIEMKSVMKASNALEELTEMMPDKARRVSDSGDQEEIPVSELNNDDVILVKPGEKIPADGAVMDGESNVNEAMVTGESKPVTKEKGDEVIGGTLNDNGSLKIKVERTGADSFLSKVINMVKEAQQTKSKTQDLANWAAGWLFYIALGAGIVTLITWLSMGYEFEYGLERMVTVMIISYPHALGLAVPLVVAISTSVSAQNGLLIRNRTAFENARKLTVILFDKTGTLIKGEFGVIRFISTDDSVENEALLQIAASLEKNSEHPIASGIVKKANELNLTLSDLKNLKTSRARVLKGV